MDWLRGCSYCQPQQCLCLPSAVQLLLYFASTPSHQIRRYEDNLHLFVRTNPSTLPLDIPRLIKGRSSCLLRNLPTWWFPSYFLSTAGNVSSETIQCYIQQQSEN